MANGLESIMEKKNEDCKCQDQSWFKTILYVVLGIVIGLMATDGSINNVIPHPGVDPVPDVRPEPRFPNLRYIWDRTSARIDYLVESIPFIIPFVVMEEGHIHEKPVYMEMSQEERTIGSDGFLKIDHSEGW